MFVILGTCVYMAGLGLMIQYRRQGVPPSVLVGCQIVLGIGGGLINVPAQLGVQASASHQEVGAATAIFLTFLEIGGAVGSAISGAIWTSGVLPKLRAYLPSDLKDQAHVIYGSVAVASDMMTYPSGSVGREAIDRAYQETMTQILIVALCVAAPIIPLSLCMQNYRLDQVDQQASDSFAGEDEEAIVDDAETEPFMPSSSWHNSSDDSVAERGSSIRIHRPDIDRRRQKSA